KYPPTPFQLAVYSKCCPSHDELDSPASFTPYIGPPPYLSQAYRFDGPMDITVFRRVVNTLCAAFSVLQTRFYRNEKIVDADVEALVDRLAWRDLAPDAFVEDVDPDAHPGLTLVTAATLSRFATEWIEAREGLDRVFSVLVVRSSAAMAAQGGAAADRPAVIFVGSTAVIDEFGCLWLAREILALHSRVARLPPSDVGPTLDKYPTQELFDFVRFAYDVEPNRHALVYWRDQVIETVQETVDGAEKDDLEAQLRRLSAEKESLKTQVASLSNRKPELEAELALLRQQRKQIDSGEDGSGGEGAMTTYTDPTSGEVMHISRSAKEALIRTVLGEEARTDNIMGLLDKHEVPPEAQRKIGASVMSIESFAALTEAAVHDLGLLSKDRRKIMALAEYVRNRIKEGMQEQTKVKFALERRIARVARDLDTCSSGLETAKDALETNDDMCIRLSNVLNPPHVEIKVPPLSLEEHTGPGNSTAASETKQQPPPPPDPSDLSAQWGFVPLVVSEETLQNLRQFQDGCRSTIRQRRAFLRGQTLPSPVAQDSEGYGSTEDSSAEEGGGGGRRGGDNAGRVSSAGPACLAAFGVLLKHISGSDKFLIGLTQTYRRNGLIVGPLTDTIPIKIDLSRRGSTFNGLFATLSRTLKEARRFGAVCPMSTLARKIGIAETLPVRFEFVPFHDTEAWAKRGLGVRDLLLSDDVVLGGDDADSALVAERLWAASEQDQFDVKLVMVEEAKCISGGMRFRRDRFDEEKITKWVAKYSATLEGIEYGSRKIPITNMISR
ncbi:hypothetical protein BDK51DRAFT_19033, partial [Blyttiomyces helicus]